MLQGYKVTLVDRTGRSQETTATGNTVSIAVHAAMLAASLPRASGGLDMMAPVQVQGVAFA